MRQGALPSGFDRFRVLVVYPWTNTVPVEFTLDPVAIICTLLFSTYVLEPWWNGYSNQWLFWSPS